MILKFARISITGLLIDFSSFSIILLTSMSILLSSVISSSIAVTFVFFASTKRLFYYKDGFLFFKFFVYLLYSLFLIFFISFLIQEFSNFYKLSPLFFKACATPFTFVLNFVFISILLNKRVIF
jgi:hypothetical protein